MPTITWSWFECEFVTGGAVAASRSRGPAMRCGGSVCESGEEAREVLCIAREDEVSRQDVAADRVGVCGFVGTGSSLCL